MVMRSTETRHPAAEGLHSLSGAEILARLLEAQAASLEAIRPAIPALTQVAEAAARSLQADGKLAYAGAGSSGLMALADCLELAGTFSLPPSRTPILFAGGAAALLHMTGAVEDDPDLAAQDFNAASLGRGDVAICVSASGATPYTLEIVRLCRNAGVLVAGFANVPQSPLLAQADIPVLLDTGAEMVAGSTRMAAGTAQKVALNMVSVLMAIHLGHVHDGFMVNLHADNAKLRERAARIVSALSGAETDLSRAALEATMGQVKPAVLVARGYSVQAAAEKLAQSRGKLAPWLE
jgi:N-acetylmuramic acid 6-phosphate etherase